MVNSYLLKKQSKISIFLKKFLHPFFMNLLINFKNFYRLNKNKKKLI